MGRTVTIRALNVLPYSLSHRTRSCNLTTTSPLPHANDCPNEVYPTFPWQTSCWFFFQPWSYGPENFVILKKVHLFRLSEEQLTEMTHTHTHAYISTSHFDINSCPTLNNSSNTSNRRAGLSCARCILISHSQTSLCKVRHGQMIRLLFISLCLVCQRWTNWIDVRGGRLNASL